jgi:hypothetical protein
LEITTVDAGNKKNIKSHVVSSSIAAFCSHATADCNHLSRDNVCSCSRQLTFSSQKQNLIHSSLVASGVLYWFPTEWAHNGGFFIVGKEFGARSLQ